MNLTPKQSTAWHNDLENQDVRRILFDGGARSTKTALICAWLAVEAERYPGALILAARKHRDHCRKSLYQDTFRKLLRGRRSCRFHDSELEIRFRNGSTIRCDGLDDQERVDKILGTEYDHIFFNEATQLTWQTVTTVLTRLARGTVPVRKAIFDCNPKSQRHWLYRVGVLNVDPDTGTTIRDAGIWRRRHWTPYDNPHLPQDALATLEALSGVQRRRMLKGEWCEAEGAVYDEWDEDVHGWRGPLPPGWSQWPVVRSIDFGYTNPFVCLWGRIDPDGRLWIVRERYARNIIVQRHAEAIKAVESNQAIWTTADHDAEDRATLHAAGIITTRARKDIQSGIAAVKRRLAMRPDGRPGLVICLDACPETASEFYDYTWEPPKEGRNAKEVPAKDRDHAMDALRYMVMRLDYQGGSGLLI